MSKTEPTSKEKKTLWLRIIWLANFIGVLLLAMIFSALGDTFDIAWALAIYYCFAMNILINYQAGKEK